MIVYFNMKKLLLFSKYLIRFLEWKMKINKIFSVCILQIYYNYVKKILKLEKWRKIRYNILEIQ